MIFKEVKKIIFFLLIVYLYMNELNKKVYESAQFNLGELIWDI